MKTSDFDLFCREVVVEGLGGAVETVAVPLKDRMGGNMRGARIRVNTTAEEEDEDEATGDGATKKLVTKGRKGGRPVEREGCHLTDQRGHPYRGG